MQELLELFPTGLALFDQFLAFGSDYLSGNAGPIGLLGYLPPLLLVLLARRTLHALLVLVLTVVTLAMFRLDAPALGFTLYAACYVAAIHAFIAREQRRRADLAAAQLALMRIEMTTFLDALDRRTRDADRQKPIPAPAPAPAPASAKEREPA